MAGLQICAASHGAEANIVRNVFSNEKVFFLLEWGG